jgi:hypothetical protein
MKEIEKPYQFEPDRGRYRVIDENGRVILSCGDIGSAEQYVVLLNEAYRRGHKAGFRDARRSESG